VLHEVHEQQDMQYTCNSGRGVFLVSKKNSRVRSVTIRDRYSHVLDAISLQKDLRSGVAN
jgi:hypothetical protein